MENVDRDLILALCPDNPRLRQLYEEHVKLEKEVKKFEQYLSYSATAQIRQKKLKKEKLKGVDAMMFIISAYRKENVIEAMH